MDLLGSGVGHGSLFFVELEELVPVLHAMRAEALRVVSVAMKLAELVAGW
jgi:hypothetical protein